MRSSAAAKTALLSFALSSFLVITAVAGSLQERVNKGPDEVAIMGYDTVAYFTEGRPMKGEPQFSYSWQDAQWQFVSVKHRNLFAADPERYAPQFGGHCAMALTQDVIKVVDPEAWIISDGKLYLTFSKRGREKFRQDISGNIKKSEGNWAKLELKN